MSYEKNCFQSPPRRVETANYPRPYKSSWRRLLVVVTAVLLGLSGWIATYGWTVPWYGGNGQRVESGSDGQKTVSRETLNDTKVVLASAKSGNLTAKSRHPSSKSEAPLDDRSARKSSTSEALSSGKTDTLETARLLTESIKTRRTQFEQTRQAMMESGTQSSPLLSQLVVATELENLAALRPIISELRGLSGSILGKKGDFASHLRALRDDLAAAPEVFRQAGDTYREYGKAEPFDDIKEDYLSLASTWDRLSELVKKNQGGLDTEAKDVEELLHYLSSTDLFLERLDRHLVSFPNLSGTHAWKGHLSELKEYVQRFQSLRQTLRGIHDRLKRDPSGDEESKPLEPTPAVSTASHFAKFEIRAAEDERLVFSLPAVKAVAPGDKLAVFRQNGALAGWATIDATEETRAVAFARSDVAVAAGDFVAMPQDKN